MNNLNQISLCLICKDEEKTIKNCLDSVKNIVDEIIILDTGSVDKTIEIAKNYTSKIIYSSWRKDFSFHRNECIKNASNPWILFLDCDETLNLNNLNLREILKNTKEEIMAYNLNILNIVSNTPICKFKALRLFRNFHNFYFENPIHEQIIPSIKAKYDYDCIKDLDIIINHYGYEPSIIKSKNKNPRNLEILNKIENKDGYTYFMMGNEYLSMDNLLDAKLYYELSLKANDSFEDEYSINFILNYISTLINLKSYEKALDFIKKAKSKIPNYRDLYFLEFWIYYYTNNYKNALVKLNQYINFKELYPDFIEFKYFENIYDLNEFKKNLSNI